MAYSSPSPYSDYEAAQALTSVVGESRWDAVALAYGITALKGGSSRKDAARLAYQHGMPTIKKGDEALARLEKEGFLKLLTPRSRVGSAENPVTKLFPATVTEQRFIEVLEALSARHPNLTCKDERETGHSLLDFMIEDGDLCLPINVKTATTAFQRAPDLVGLDPQDCIPIPVYKAQAALEKLPNLLYVVSVDFTLVAILDQLLPTLFTREERIVWDLLNKYEGARLRTAEDSFVFATVRKHWETLREAIRDNPFHVISARKAIRVLHTQPKRTPGIGLRAWGTGASAEVNVHLSIKEDTTPWDRVSTRIESKGLGDVVDAINKRRQEWIYDPEI